jgi:hypothetical protein
MTEDDVVEILRNTTHTGKPVSYDADMGDWKPLRPVGTLSYANGPCGTTLAISTKGMKLVTMWRLMGWARKEIRNRNTDVEELLTQLRQKIDKKVLSH